MATTVIVVSTIAFTVPREPRMYPNAALSPKRPRYSATVVLALAMVVKCPKTVLTSACRGGISHLKLLPLPCAVQCAHLIYRELDMQRVPW